MLIEIENVNISYDLKNKVIALHFITLENKEEELPKLSKYFVIDALGRTCFVKTTDRLLAQKVVDIYFGKGHYTVKCSAGDKQKGNGTVRATEFRKGQQQQRQKSRILNS